MKIRLFIKYLTLLSAITLLPLWVLSNRLAGIGQDSLKIALMELQLANIGAAVAVFDNYAGSLSEKAGSLLGNLVAGDWQGKMQVLTAFIEMNPEVTAVSVVTLSGKELVRAGPRGGTEQVGSYSASEDFLKAKDAKAASHFISAGTDSLVYYCPFGEKLYLRIEAGLDKPFAALAADKVYGGYLVLADSQGRPLIPPGLREGPGRVLISEAQAWLPYQAALRNSMGAGSMEFNDSGRAMLGTYAPLRNSMGAVVAVQPLKEAYKSVLFLKKQAALYTAATILLVFICLAAVSWLLAGRLSGEPAAGGNNSLTRLWNYLKTIFQDDSRFPWGRLSLVSAAIFAVIVASMNMTKAANAEAPLAITEATSLLVFLTSLFMWADKAIGRRAVRSWFILPLRITLKVLSGIAGLGLAAWLGALVYLAFRGGF